MCIHVMSDCPKNVEIVGARSSSTVAEGTVLTCAGEAHPPPSYQWTDAVSNSTVEGDTFVVAAMKYHSLTCTVTTNVTFANGTTETCGSSVHFEVKGRSPRRNTSSSAVAKRPRDASCLSVVSFKSTKRRVESFIVSYVGYRFVTACS